MVLFLFNVKRQRGKGLWVIFIYLAYCFINEAINTYFNQFRHITDYFFFNVFTIIEYTLLTYYIYRLVKNGVFRRIMITLSVSFYLISVLLFLGSKEDTIDSIMCGSEFILLIIYSIYYLFEQMRKPDHIFFYAIPEFWIIVAILLYFSGTFFLFTYAQSLIKDTSFMLQYAVINSSFYILKNILWGVAMCVRGGDQSTLPKIDYSSFDEHLNLNR